MPSIPPNLAKPQPLQPFILQIWIQPGSRRGRHQIGSVFLFEIFVVSSIRRGIARSEPVEHFKEFRPRYPHDVSRLENFVFPVEQPDGWHVRLPPDGLGCVGLFAHKDLGGHYAALVVDAHQRAEGEVEDDPGCDPESEEGLALWEADGGEY